MELSLIMRKKILGKTLKRNIKKDQVFKLSYFKN